jgi:large subunit ribosomal protein L21
MYAVIESGGKQYRVELGNEIEVDRLDVEAGQTIQFERVLLVADGEDAQIGQPLVEAAVVTADVLRQDRGEKLVVFKYKPKARTRVKKGHRADLTVLRIAEIAIGDRSAARDAAAAASEQKAAREAAEAAAATRASADKKLAAKLDAGDKAATAAKADKGKAAAKPATKTAASKSRTSDKPAGRTASSRTQAGEDKTKAAAPKGAAAKGSTAKAGTSKASGTAKADAAPRKTTRTDADASDKKDE